MDLKHEEISVENIASKLYKIGFDILDALREAEKIEKEVKDKDTGKIDMDAYNAKMRWYRGE